MVSTPSSSCMQSSLLWPGNFAQEAITASVLCAMLAKQRMRLRMAAAAVLGACRGHCSSGKQYHHQVSRFHGWFLWHSIVLFSSAITCFVK